MATIQWVRSSLEAKKDSVTLVVADLRKMDERVKEMKESTATLKVNTVALMVQIGELRATSRILEARLKNYEGRS
ncbi:hypothetical protein NDU88_004647 [Pleurodeles waltl]|uniref:Uncharacterized protein n=1 Tax=Pleurodeles waltl TaxID=8319 RepID=A0AAV7T8Q9_PLEWA|nr:hypothetical protein NDU88_004647 [Pleurodeles waltl]